MMARARRSPDPARDEAPDRIEERPQRSERWNRRLVWFMRVVAILWIAKGLAAWSVIVGAGGALPPFEARATGFQAIVIYFAVIDLVAAVGLWLASTWGGVLWLLAVMSHLVLTFFFPSVLVGGWPAMAAFSVLIAVYLVLSWLSAEEIE
jgi:fatty acid desaturase